MEVINLDRSTQPILNQIDKISIKEASEGSLDNGIPVYTIDAGIQDLIRIEFLFEIGNWNESQRLQAYATNKLMKSGTESYNALQLTEKLDYYGAFVNLKPEADTTSIVLFCLNKHLEKVLPIMKELLMKQVFPEDELQIFVENRIQKLRVRKAQNDFVAKSVFDEVIFGKDHPYGYYAQEADYNKLNVDIVKAFYKQHYIANKCKIILAGKVFPELVSLVNRHFGQNDWVKTNGLEPEIELNTEVKSDPELIHHIKKKDAMQSAIKLGRIMFNKRDPDFMDLRIMNTLLGGFFGSRLMKNIREDKGYTYGIHSALISLRKTGVLYIFTEVGINFNKKTLSEIYLEFRRLKGEKVKVAELDLVRNYMLGSFMAGVDGPFALAKLLKENLIHDLGYDYYHNFIERIKTIKRDRIQQLANKYLNEDSMHLVMVG